jgi:hypothetical protein
MPAKVICRNALLAAGTSHLSFGLLSQGWLEQEVKNKSGHEALVWPKNKKLCRAVTQTVLQAGRQCNLPVLHAGRNFGKDDIIFYKWSVASPDRPKRADL